MSNEAQIDTAASAMARDAVVASLVETDVATSSMTRDAVVATRVARANAGAGNVVAAQTQVRAQGSRPITTSWLALSGPRLPARSVRGEARMTMSMLPWISPATERVEDVVPARMTMTRQVATARTTIGRQR